jgi:predicted ribosome quality control (RQC) complex YloA/Tae2 family protein
VDEDGPSALVQEADCAERVVVLKVRSPGVTSFVIIAATNGLAGAGLVPQGARQATWGARLPPGADRQRGREDALVGARVLGIGDKEIVIDQRGDRRVVRAERARVVVTEAAGGDAPPLVSASDDVRARWEKSGLALLHAAAEDAIDVRRTEIARMLDRAKQKIERRAEAVRGDLGKIAQADKIASQAQWLVAEAARAPRGATKLVVTDWSSGEAVPIVVPLDPSKGAREQVEAMFKRAKRLRLGARIAEDRLAQARTQLDAVAAAAARVSVAKSLGEIDEAARDAKKAAPRDVALPGATAAPAKKKGEGARRTPFRTFHARSGRKIFVGKGAADNDALTQSARPHDLWLHAKDRTGAHVIVPLDKGQTCPAEDLVDAAHLAAHFSDAREEKVIDVQYTQKRHLRKPKGSPPGLVMVDREKVLVLRVEADLLRTLLEREDT